MAITFPASPADGATYTNPTTGVQYIYNAEDGVWKTYVWPSNTNYLQLSGGTLTGDLSLGTNDLTAQDITATGGLTVGNGLTVSDGNIVMASGHGIDFSATANAASNSAVTTSELLDDYEEGTWTPFYCKTTTEENMYSGNQLKIYQAHYQKIGNTVFYSCYVSNSGAGEGVTSFTYDTDRVAGDSISIGGLPYVIKSDFAHYQAGTVGYFNAWVSWTSGYTPMCYANPGKTSIVLNYAVQNTSTGVLAQHLAGLDSGVMVAGMYVAD
jgi:hypothetical protein